MPRAENGAMIILKFCLRRNMNPSSNSGWERELWHPMRNLLEPRAGNRAMAVFEF